MAGIREHPEGVGSGRHRGLSVDECVRPGNGRWSVNLLQWLATFAAVTQWGSIGIGQGSGQQLVSTGALRHITVEITDICLKWPVAAVSGAPYASREPPAKLLRGKDPSCLG